MPDAEIIQGVLAKMQPTPGVDAVPVVGTDAVRITQDRLFSKLQVDYEWQNMRDDTASGTIVPPKPGIPRGRKIRADFFWEMKGAGIDAPPETDPLYRAGGWAQTDGTQLFSYAQASLAHEMASIYYYAGGLLFKAIDNRGRWRWPLAAGTNGVHQFTMFGLLAADPVTAALPGGFVYDSNDPIAGVNSGLTIGGVAPEWISGMFDPIGVDPELLESGNAVDGIVGFDYATVTPRFSLNVRKSPLATYDPYADLKARTTRALLLTYGSAQFNRVKLLSTNLSYLEHNHAAAKGYAHFDLNWFVEQATLQFD
jgi:hypothetical protein